MSGPKHTTSSHRLSAKGRRDSPECGCEPRSESESESEDPRADPAPGAVPGPGRRYLVFDADGELVATFASWDAAHAWSHLRAAEPLTMLPVRIEDHIERRTWTVDADQCRMTVWRRHVEYRICLPESLLPAAQAHVL
ncbi:MAG: hypothetical protein ACQSGP_05480 [Frankia sp.]